MAESVDEFPSSSNDADNDEEDYQQNVFDELMKPRNVASDEMPILRKEDEDSKEIQKSKRSENGLGGSPVKNSAENPVNISLNSAKNETATSLEVNYNDTTLKMSQDEMSTDNEADSSLRKSMLALTSKLSGSDEKSPLKPIKKTFYGGVRYFAPTKGLDEETSEIDENPFEPRKPVFRAVRKGRRGRTVADADSGEKPYNIFGDVEYKFEFVEEEPVAQSPRYANYDPQATLENVDRSLTENLAKPANYLSFINRSLPATPGGRGRGRGRGTGRGRGRGRGRGGRPPGYVKSPSSVPTIFRPFKQPLNDSYVPLSPESQAKADMDSRSYNFANGARVFAKWPDKNCYPGNVLSFDGFGKYKVRFLDGEIREMPPTSIVALVQLKVEDFCPDVDDVSEWNAGIFEVENKVKRAVEKVCWEKFVLDSFQAKKFITTRINEYAQELNTPGNSISETKARRSCVYKRPRYGDTSMEGADDFVYYDDDDDFDDDDDMRRSKKRRKFAVEDYYSDDDDDMPPEKPKFTAAAARPTAHVLPTRMPQQGQKRAYVPSTSQVIRTKPPPPKVTQSPRLANLQPRPNNEQKEKSKYAETIVVIKPYQPERPLYNKTLFAGMLFAMTSATRTKDNSGPEDEDNAPPIPFNKRIIRQHIEESGGTVLDDFSQVEDASNNCFLIADTHYRTHKYLSALVRAIPCVSHMWILDCVKDMRLFSHTEYILPAGRSLETGSIVPWHDKCLTLLSGLKMFVHTENRHENPALLDFSQIWTPIARSMGATILDTLPEVSDDPLSKFDILLTDTTCPEYYLNTAKALNATPVSSEWLIQAIITGTLPSTSAHAKYQNDYVDQPAAVP